MNMPTIKKRLDFRRRRKQLEERGLALVEAVSEYSSLCINSGIDNEEINMALGSAVKYTSQGLEIVVNYLVTTRGFFSFVSHYKYLNMVYSYKGMRYVSYNVDHYFLLNTLDTLIALTKERIRSFDTKGYQDNFRELMSVLNSAYKEKE